MVRSLKHKGGKTMKRRVSKGGAKKSKKHLGRKSRKHVGKKSRKHNKTKRSAKKGGGFFSSEKEIPKSMIYQNKPKEIFGNYLHTRDEEDNVTSRIIIGATYNTSKKEGTIYALDEKLYNGLKDLKADRKYYIDGNKLYTKSGDVYQENHYLNHKVLEILSSKGINDYITFDKSSFDSKYKKHLISDGPYNNKFLGFI